MCSARPTSSRPTLSETRAGSTTRSRRKRCIRRARGASQRSSLAAGGDAAGAGVGNVSGARRAPRPAHSGPLRSSSGSARTDGFATSRTARRSSEAGGHESGHGRRRRPQRQRSRCSPPAPPAFPKAHCACHRRRPPIAKRRRGVTRASPSMSCSRRAPSVLQDLGFAIDESETRLGIVVASKERSAVDEKEVAAAYLVTVLSILVLDAHRADLRKAPGIARRARHPPGATGPRPVATRRSCASRSSGAYSTTPIVSGAWSPSTGRSSISSFSIACRKASSWRANRHERPTPLHQPLARSSPPQRC